MYPVLPFRIYRRERFYHVETTVSGKSIVTPRGWEDLSKMLGKTGRKARIRIPDDTELGLRPD